MSIRLDKAWVPLDAEGIAMVKGQLGVYQLGNADGEVVFIGVADARSLFGLRGELETELGLQRAPSYRIEVTTAYTTRYRELLMVHFADHGAYPAMNSSESLPRLGRISPG